MQQMFNTLRDRVAAGARAVLCSIIASSGSTPRGAGAKMAVFDDGSTVGTIGGGAVEFRATEIAQGFLCGEEAGQYHFDLSNHDKTDLGMVCGGKVTVYFQPMGSESLPLLDAVCARLAAGGKAWLLTRLDAPAMGLYEDGELKFLSLEGPVEPLLGPQSVLTPTVYSEPLTIPGTVYVFGGGHVAQALVPLLHTVHFRTVIYDSRPHAVEAPAFAQAAKIYIGNYSRVLERVTITEEDYVVVMTPGHQSDREILAQVLKTPARYIGCIGSRSKIAMTNKLLREQGFTDTDIARVWSPIGLPIGGETPEEVALSIAAQLVAVRSGKM